MPETRLAALRELIDFAGMSAYNGGSMIISYPDGTTNIRRDAAKSLHSAADDATVQKALDSRDPLLNFWGIWHSQTPAHPEVTIPKLERFAEGNDLTLRTNAVERLRGIPAARDFIDKRNAMEKSPWVLDQLLFAGREQGRPALQDKLRGLLDDPDPKVRLDIIKYLSANWISAASRQIFFDAPMMDALLKRAQAGQPADADAKAALAAFTALANGPGFADAATAAAWWKDHRTDWELARFARSYSPNGPIRAAIVTTEEPGGTPDWHASIIVTNQAQGPRNLNLAEIEFIQWDLYDSGGRRIRQGANSPAPQPQWVTLEQGQSVQKDATFDPTGMRRGRYILRGTIMFGLHREGLPAGMALTSVQIPMPAIILDVPHPALLALAPAARASTAQAIDWDLLLKQLASDHFDQRDAAQKQLEHVDFRERGKLEQLAASAQDPEVQGASGAQALEGAGHPDSLRIRYGNLVTVEERKTRRRVLLAELSRAMGVAVRPPTTFKPDATGETYSLSIHDGSVWDVLEALSAQHGLGFAFYNGAGRADGFSGAIPASAHFPRPPRWRFSRAKSSPQGTCSPGIYPKDRPSPDPFV